MKSIRVGFINSSGSYNADPFRNQPLTIIYLLTYLEKYFGEKLGLSLIDLEAFPKMSSYLTSLKMTFFFTPLLPLILMKQKGLYKNFVTFIR